MPENTAPNRMSIWMRNSYFTPFYRPFQSVLHGRVHGELGFPNPPPLPLPPLQMPRPTTRLGNASGHYHFQNLLSLRSTKMNYQPVLSIRLRQDIAQRRGRNEQIAFGVCVGIIIRVVFNDLDYNCIVSACAEEKFTPVFVVNMRPNDGYATLPSLHCVSFRLLFFRRT